MLFNISRWTWGQDHLETQSTGNQDILSGIKIQTFWVSCPSYWTHCHIVVTWSPLSQPSNKKEELPILKCFWWVTAYTDFYCYVDVQFIRWLNSSIMIVLPLARCYDCYSTVVYFKNTQHLYSDCFVLYALTINGFGDGGLK